MTYRNKKDHSHVIISANTCVIMFTSFTSFINSNQVFWFPTWKLCKSLTIHVVIAHAIIIPFCLINETVQGDNAYQQPLNRNYKCYFSSRVANMHYHTEWACYIVFNTLYFHFSVINTCVDKYKK